MILPRYPVYIPSKGRCESSLTANALVRDGVPFRLVVEPQEADQYRAKFGDARVLVLPFSNLGQGSIPARNWIKDHSTAEGAARHWQLDDNMSRFRMIHENRRIPCRAGVALRACEDFTDRYSNVPVSGLNYSFFVIPPSGRRKTKIPPFYSNVHVYSCTLVKNDSPYRWRGRYNEDTDLCLQVLSAGECTILLNAFMVEKKQTLKVKGGNTAELYQGDGRLKMARELERRWPGVVTTRRRFDRPQHVVADQWRRFDTPLKLRPDADLAPVNYGLRVAQHAEQVKHPAMRDLLERGKDGIE